MKMNNRSGSALLIVLGMLSFMVVSAIGFSVFMRQNRLPSSFVRRNTTSHQLLKAALARAMNELDSAIGDDPFPGIDSEASHNSKPLKGVSNTSIDDTWKGRVFVGEIRSGYAANVNTNSEEVLVAHDKTVSTLTMEGLAYLPPCLVNEARYFSRHTPTAQWHSLAYDAGRYAYTAINVSDYFDINNVPFTGMRSYTPTNRVTLAYLFKSDAQAKNFNNALVKDYAPFVSLADFNLVMYNKVKNPESYGIVSPFGKYASGQGTFDRYFGNFDTNSITRTTFVADSYFPEEVSEELLDLNDEECQPFSSLNQKKNIQQVYKDAQSRAFYTTLQEKFNLDLSAPTLANLYDYLDKDSLPVSLAIPSVEQVPVIAGYKIGALNGLKLRLKRMPFENGGIDPANPEGATGPENEPHTYPIKYMLEVVNSPELTIDVTTLFPFKDVQSSGFDVHAAAHIFWGPTGNDSWGNGNCGSMKMSGVNSSDPKEDLVVSGLFTENKEEGGGVDEFNRISFGSKTKAIAGNSVSEPAQALVGSQLSLKIGSKVASIPFAVIEESWTYVKKDKDSIGKWQYNGDSEARILSNESVCYVNEGHRKDNPPSTVKPYLALRIMVKNNDGVVDMAPASGWDDTLNSHSVLPNFAPLLGGMDRSAFIESTTDAEIEYSVEGLHNLAFQGNPSDISLSINSVSRYCKDPKWNHNVHNWTTLNDGGNIETEIINTFDGNEGRDSDFFQSVSNSTNLLSIAELAMLPRTMDFSEGSKMLAGCLQRGRSDEEAKNIAKSLPLNEVIAKAQSANVYLCSSYDGDDTSVESLFADGTGGFRINPYSDDPNILRAVIANTPYDWSTAAPKAKGKGQDSEDEVFSDDDLPSIEIARKMRDGFYKSFKKQVNNGEYPDWVAAYNDLGWGISEGEGIFEDVRDNILTSADKKFLYGFWKGCFANRQQLFIIFLRAEPSVGSGVAGVGQGGRAVAVVWRDPRAPKKSDGSSYKELDLNAPPHKMRVLFYKPLE